ncbi:XRE family transcriptional regulator [Lachnospiraceae bacterium AM48-27BH]|nr:XRE family transcriptional regulator [Lachnospiraceae bacterium AM48-27BH]
MATFKEMLKYLRTRENLSQSELASKIGVAKSTISMYEAGKREPDFETLEAIADLFNVDMNFLLGRDGTENDEHYYFNNDARDLAQFVFENPEYKVLFDASRKVKKEDIEFVKQMIDRVRGDSNDTGC